MAVKKTVKKRRSIKKAKIAPIDNIIEALEANAELSAVNKGSIKRLHKAGVVVERQQKMLVTSQERIEKARLAVVGAKTPAVREKAKSRLALARGKAKEVRSNLSLAITEHKKAERLVRGLYKAMNSAFDKMQREYDKRARSLEKAIDKPLRRRRTSKKKVVITPPEQN